MLQHPRVADGNELARRANVKRSDLRAALLRRWGASVNIGEAA